ncbi:response regulator [Pediococcus ethanolidurans]|uniref:response regulator transcription factor n=1 Tax=Pediococcus ethanolidurans TaxID=319653 RepID=UPI002952F34D|nr:response regulator transcription factor [Pediococcus ethanolidurans]MDV7719389.1 response regulator [Pediococcus ethanolidurans]
MNKKILVVDDEPSIVTLLTYNLNEAGFQVASVGTGNQALTWLKTNDADLIVMDLMLPGIDGLETIRQIRGMQKDTPVIILTAKNNELDKIVGFEIGADDYLTKPFSPRELIARIKAVLRRTENGHQPVSVTETSSQIRHVDDLSLDLDRYEVRKNQQKISLTPNEYKLLVYLWDHADHVLSREKILNAVWGYDYAGQTRMVDIHISHLRDKIEDNPKDAKLILTVRGFGYEFNTKKNAE